MDITERKITKIAREAEKLVLVSLREQGVGTAEIDLIHALRHNKAAVARRTKNLEAKGFLVRRDDPADRRSRLIFPTERAKALKSSKAEIEASFYEYLTDTLTSDEAKCFVGLLDRLYAASKAESRAGFPHFKEDREVNNK